MATQAPEQSKEVPELHITIGAYPSGGLHLDGELRMVKAASLYADHIELYSLKASLLFAALEQMHFSPQQQVELLRRVTPHLAQGDDKGLVAFLNEYSEGFPGRSVGERRLLEDKFHSLLASQWEKIKDWTDDLRRQVGADALEQALRSGLVELHTFEATENDERRLELLSDAIISGTRSQPSGSDLTEMRERDRRILTEFVQGVCGAVSDGFTYPLFDAETSELVREGVQGDRLAVSRLGLERGRHVGLAADLLKRLPLFDQAPMDEILDIRGELEKPLIRFRAAVLRFSESIECASWDAEFPLESERVFLRDVGPAILDIEEEVRSNKLLTAILRKLADKPLVLPSGSMLSFAISQMASLPREIMGALGVGGASAIIVYDAYREWQQRKQTIERNHLFFYYRAGERLSK